MKNTTVSQQLIIIFLLCVCIVMTALFFFVYIPSTRISDDEYIAAVSETHEEPTLSHTDPIIIPSNHLSSNTTNIIFSLNVHDFVFPTRSTETVREVIRIHEQYNIPIDIYLDDQIVHAYQETDPEIFDLLRESEVVSVSYHVRAPNPWVNGFDTIGLQDLSPEDLFTTITAYEEHRIDTSTGKLLEEPGGYQYLTDLLGYPPKSVGYIDIPRYGKTLAQVYSEKGAQFAVVHGRDAELGDTLHNLFVRPEHVDLKLYEHRGSDAATVLAQAVSELPSSTDYPFIGIKMHENNWYTVNTPFWPIYWTDPKKTTPLEPPYGVDSAAEQITIRPPFMQEEMWELYEDTVKLIAENTAEYEAFGLSDLEQMIE